MALTTAQQVRDRIQDYPRIADVQRYGDGSGSAFTFDHRNITSGSAYIMVSGGGVPATGWSATGATFNVSGYATFSAVPSANSALRFRYVHSVFSDDAIDHHVSALGNVNEVALEFARQLLFDGTKRAAWASPDGSTYDDTKAIDAIKAIIDDLKDERADEAAAAGGFNSWSVTQTEV